MQKTYWTSLKKVLFILPLFFMYGCGLWGNFTTLFNLYYNTRDDFQEAERLINEQKRDLFSNEDLPVPGTAIQLLNKVEVKASKILQFHAQTAFVDDALLMLGKSYYYQKNYQKALRKFQELILTQKDNDLYLEDSLWIGKTQMRLKEFDDALRTLPKVRSAAIFEEEDKIFEEAFIEEIKYYIFKEDYSTAISLINQFLELPGSNIVKGKVSYELGNLYIKTNNLPEAIKAFENVTSFTSDFDVVLDSKLGLAEAQRLNGNPEASLNILSKLSTEQKYSESYHRIDLAKGFAYMQQEKYPEALQTFTKVDTAYPSTLSAGTARFKKAEIYESKIVNYDSAYTFYMKASTSGAPPDIAVQANERATRFKKYQYIRSLIEENKKFLTYALDTAAFKKDSLAFYSDTLKHEQQEARNEDNRDLGRDERGNFRNDRPVNNPKIQEEKKPPMKSNLPADSLQKLVVKSEFDIANLFFTEMNRADSAYYYYNDIVSNYPPTIYSGRTLYALAGYFQSINDSTKADSLYNVIYENYKGESVVNAAAQKLHKDAVDLEYDPAKQLYVDAEKLLNENKFIEAVNKFYNIHIAYPKSPQAPKALLATGWILENKLVQNDSAAAVYDSLISKYPLSAYANNVRQKIAIYKEERLKKQKEREEALKKKEVPPVTDSTKVVRDENLVFPQKPLTAQDSLKLQHSLTTDSLKRKNFELNNPKVIQDTLNPSRQNPITPPGKIK